MFSGSHIWARILFDKRETSLRNLSVNMITKSLGKLGKIQDKGQDAETGEVYSSVD
jgi:hypothetical protein